MVSEKGAPVEGAEGRRWTTDQSSQARKHRAKEDEILECEVQGSWDEKIACYWMAVP